MMRSIIGAFIISCLAVVAGAPVCAQPADWANVVEAAKKEGEVIVWGQSGEARRKFWKDAFEKAYPGITVRLFQAGTSSERDTRFLREMEAKVASVDVLVSGSAGMNGRLRPAGVLRPMRPLLRPDVLDAKKWIDGEPLWTDPEKQYIIVSDQPVASLVLTNSSVNPSSIRSWKDLLDPKYDRKITSLDPRQSGMGFALSLFLFYNPSLGPDFVSKLFAKGRVVFSGDERQMVEWTDSGRMLLALAIREPEIAALEHVGGKVGVINTLEAGGRQQGMLVGADGAAGVPALDPLPHPNAARVYLNWFFSKDGQQAMVDNLGLTSTNTDVDMKALNPRTLRVAGATYTSANDDKFNSASGARAMREVVNAAIEGR